jgi:hypothetical protein
MPCSFHSLFHANNITDLLILKPYENACGRWHDQKKGMRLLSLPYLRDRMNTPMHCRRSEELRLAAYFLDSFFIRQSTIEVKT